MTQSDSAPPNRGNAPLFFILAVVIALCVAGGGLLFLKRHKSARAHRGPTAVKLTGNATIVALGGGGNLKLVHVAPGEFLMGSDETDPDADPSESDEDKKHKVTLKYGFYIGATEVTRAQYKAVMNYDPSAFKDPKRYPDAATNMELPADQVSWGDAHKWCDEVHKRTGLNVRLPSEAEWEFACRAGTTTPFSTGKALTAAAAQFDATTATPPGAKPDTTAVVGTHEPNAFGLFDMHGNVSEWVEDNFHSDYANAPTDGSAWPNAQQPWLHVHRGGSWNNTAPTCRSAMREAGGSQTEPELRTSQIGFRIVISED